MLSPVDIENMNAVQRRKLAERLACDLLDVTNGQFKKLLAEHISVSYETVKNWWRDDKSPSTLVILYLQSEHDRRSLETVLKGLGSALDRIR